MVISRAQLKQDAKDALKNKWGLAIAVIFLCSVFCIVITTAAREIPARIMQPNPSLYDSLLNSFLIGSLANLLFAPPLTIGLSLFFLRLIRKEQLKIPALFSGFDIMWKAVGTAFITGLFTFLWSLLLIVPGIIAALRYSMVYFILADNPDMGVMQAIRESKQLTAGHKMDIFVLGLSFLGWILLCILTLGIGFLWLSPYMYATYAGLYDQLKASH